MEIETKRKVVLGIFVFLGIAILLGVVYVMGSSRGMFEERIEVSAVFKNVKGLQAGNNVRFSGIKIGVVKEVRLVSDSTAKVVMKISKNAARFIKTNSYASVETEGLMGNMLVTISSGSEDKPSVKGGDELLSKEPVSMENIMERINQTTEQTTRLTKNLADISDRIQSGKGPLGSLIYDSSLMKSINRSIKLMETSGENAKKFTSEIAVVAKELNDGDGLVPKLIDKKEWASDVDATLDSLHKTSQMMTEASRELRIFMKKLNKEKGTVEKLLADSAMAQDLHQAIINFKQGTENLDDAINTVDNSWILNLFGGDDDD